MEVRKSLVRVRSTGASTYYPDLNRRGGGMSDPTPNNGVVQKNYPTNDKAVHMASITDAYIV